MAAQTYPVAVICKLLDLTPQRIRQLVNEGVIPRAERGRYELVPAVRGYIKYLRDRAIGKEGEQSSDIASARTRLIRENADRAAMENAKARGELIPAPLLVKALEQTFTAFGARIEAIPRKAVPRLKTVSGDAAREKLLRDLVREALSELSNFDFDRLVGRIDKESSGGGNGSAAPAGPVDLGVGGPIQGSLPRGKRGAREVEHIQS